MAKTANKYALRKAAEERRNRHAQRTPLPPKPGTIEAAKEVIEATKPPKPRKKPSELPNSKSGAKAKDFIESVKEHGWEIEVATPDSGERDHIEVTAMRGPESIVSGWINGVHQGESCIYTVGDRSRRLRNASEAKRYAARPVEEVEEALERKARRKNPQGKSRVPNRRKPVAEHPSLIRSTEVEIKKALAGQSIVWINRISGEREEARVSNDPKQITLRTDPQGELTVNILCHHTGYRSFVLSSLIEIGGKRVAGEGE